MIMLDCCVLAYSSQNPSFFYLYSFAKLRDIEKGKPYNYYFLLQWRRLNRWLTDVGIHPYIAYAFLIPTFLVLSKLVFWKTELAEWIYLCIALSLVFKLCSSHRGEQLSLIFQKKDFLQVRFVEHLLAAIPFVIYLIYESRWLVSGILLLGSLLLVFYPKKFGISRVIPTPFKKMPFEFIVGFRKTFLLFLLDLFVLVKAIQVDNFYLALFCLAACFLIFCSYYFEPEKKYFVWMFDMNVNQFLKHKIKFGIISSLILTIPFAIALLIFYPAEWFLILAVEVIGLIVVLTIVLAKYSAFPGQMNLPQTILFVLSLFFPFLLVFAIPIFYTQAKRRLSTILR